MGLDMYFEASKNVNKRLPVALEKKFGDLLGSFRSCVETHTIGYFRGFNALHNYIVDNFAEYGYDNTQRIPLTEERIEEVLDVLKQVRDDHELACSLLPMEELDDGETEDYDEDYFVNVSNACDLFEGMLDIVNEYDLEYYAWY